ncbi:MAG: SUMF1/EgtB/PvdO family nonheme iron enzyme [Acidobacteriota bacterium]
MPERILSVVTSKRIAVGALVLFLLALGATAPYWLLPLIEFAGSHSSHLEGMAALVQIVLWGGAGVLALIQVWGLRRRTAGQSDVLVLHPGSERMSPDELWRLIGDRHPAPDVARVTERYLEHLVDRYRFLDFRGMGVSDRAPLRLPLLDMYVPLKARIDTPEGETWERVHVAGRAPCDEERVALRRLSEPRPVLDLLKHNDGLVLLGDPGAGKTTFVKFAALALATGQGDALGLGARLPVLLPVSAYAAALAAGDISLIPFIARYYHDRGVELPLEGMLEEAFGKGGVLLFLDGLDEVRELERRHLVVERVRDFYSFHRRAGNKFVLTSRIVGYREVRPAAEGLAECTLVDFDDAEIESFVGRWTAAVEKAAAGETQVAALEAQREKDELLAAVRRNPGVRSLASNPLLLTILALMKRQGVSLPERRVHLYETYVETLLKHWNLARSLGGRSGRDLDLVETMKILPPLALWMHRASPGVGLVREGDLLRELERIYQERRHEDPASAARHFLEDVREHTALLLDRGGRQYGFIHLTFQEYLAAVALAQKGQQGIEPIVEALAEHVGQAPWHEVTLLTIGYLGVVQQRDEAASAVLEELIRRAPGPAGEAVVLAGQAAADAGAGGVTRPCRRKVVEELLRVLGDDRVEAPRRAAAGQALASIGDPRPEAVTVDGMHLCLVPAGPFLLGSDDADDIAQDCEKPLHRYDIGYDYRIGRFPVTVAQLREHNPELAASQAANQPAGMVTWHEARAFCDWLAERWRKAGLLEPGWTVRLPSEAEWQKAARGGLEVPAAPVTGPASDRPAVPVLEDNRLPARLFPWGNPMDPNRANQRETGIGETSAVGCFPSGASPYGCEEMGGNVWEWTRSLFAGYPYPSKPEERSRREDPASPGARVLLGGSYLGTPTENRCAARLGEFPTLRDKLIGFRVVVAPE